MLNGLWCGLWAVGWWGCGFAVACLLLALDLWVCYGLLRCLWFIRS